ncbi:kinase suppressor of Ras 2-like [Contarinia nasturtii]|uniref:kinase suppressor of Ras 2-like n=1 Tax=Contarinia nasturtii TaxID=265458 RepID=UPI0012D48FF2|nr:kinase suppressor of Ras 2-like [Contarinia nasturtii]XP_031637321.1 kinase suppressor of Ras 2-like [Contarinia nasturtii]
MANDINQTGDYGTNIRYEPRMYDIEVILSMIDISADRLEDLRTQCATSAELTQQEIRTLETKLVKMFSELLITKAKLPKAITSTGSELKQWLRVVGLSQESLDVVLQRVNTLEILLDKNDCELRGMLNYNLNIREEEVRRFLRAIFNLKRCREAITVGTNEPIELFWDSWDRHQSTASASPRSSRLTSRYQQHQQYNRMVNSIAENHVQTVDITIRDKDTTVERQNHLISPEDTSASTLTPSPSPPNSPSYALIAAKIIKRNGTPPTRKRNQAIVVTMNQSMQPNNSYHQYSYQQQFTPPTTSPQSHVLNNIDQNSLPKSRSQESKWMDGGSVQDVNRSSISSTNSVSVNSTNPSNAIHKLDNFNYSVSINNTTANLPTPRRDRLHTEPNPEHFNDIADNSLTVPRSPCTPIIIRGMAHMIAHRFTKKLNMMHNCYLCNKTMFIGLKCKECKYRCHKECEPYVPPSCGLPPAFIDEFKKTLPSDVFLPNTSPNMVKSGGFLSSARRDRHRSQAFTNQYIGAPDSSSAGSSCSSPSSPALLMVPPHTPAASKQTQFHFPDLGCDIVKHRLTDQIDMAKEQQKRVAIDRTFSTGLTDTTRSNGSDKTDKTISLSGSISASTDSVRSDSTEERGNGHWPRQNSLSLKEWDIPWEDLKLLEEIGSGRFGTVHRGLWHGDVAVKLFNEGYLDDEHALEAFKLEIATFKKTRHENLVLFMGFCMKPQAMVTSLCKGNTLFTHIHSRRDKFNLYRAILVAQQISQGMGYLHAKEIIHKDLKTKNIFLENGKVVITDFGLFSTTKLRYAPAGLFIEENMLCYLAPELITQLRAVRPTKENLPFSKASDIFAFGTIWYELLCGEFPFKGQAAESTIYQIGRGMKYTLANVQVSRDVKDILMLCSAYCSADRPDFAKLLTLLERLPKKRLARSPSHPVQLSRSAESVF